MVQNNAQPVDELLEERICLKGISQAGDCRIDMSNTGAFCRKTSVDHRLYGAGKKQIYAFFSKNLLEFKKGSDVV